MLRGLSSLEAARAFDYMLPAWLKFSKTPFLDMPLPYSIFLYEVAFIRLPMSGMWPAIGFLTDGNVLLLNSFEMLLCFKSFFEPFYRLTNHN